MVSNTRLEPALEVVRLEGLTAHVLAGVPLEKLKISGTPTLLLVDKTGTVLNAWIGMLSPRQELEVMRATTAAAGEALNGPGPIVQNEGPKVTNKLS